MNTLFGSLGARTRSLVLLCSSRSSKHITSRPITGYLFHHNHHYATKSHQPQHKISSEFLHRGRRYSTVPNKTSDPLHILFCGSDYFSCASLQALYDEHVRNPDLIRSIDVVVRPGKRTGRGYYTIRIPPVRTLAENLGLPIHEKDTFIGWNMPPKTNLIIAVSFGLFVPARLLRAAKYGGLNLHPSLLPDLRGPAPLQHTLLKGRTETGVSLQTLDHAAFDHGVVLAQTAPPLRIPPSCTTVAELQSLVTPLSTQMLIDGLRAGLHVPPHESVHGPEENPAGAEPLVHAPKITKVDRQVTLSMLRACESEVKEEKEGEGEGEGGEEVSPAPLRTLTRRQAAIGPHWFLSRDRQGRQKRIIIQVLAEVPTTGSSSWLRDSIPNMIATSNDQANHLNNGNNNNEHDDESSPLPVQKYLIPFEENLESQQQTQPPPNGPLTPPKSSMNLVFWDPLYPSDPPLPSSPPIYSPFLPQTSPPVPKEEDDGGSLYLGNYRILSLKVEGEKAKPARHALYHFILNR
ncbi:formyl transferase [Xylaria sp. FL1042]|nr:formyl transferase [Xylaria sp. FL1042]